MYVSYLDVRNFSLMGIDELLGQIDDIYIDQKTWKIAYIVVQTGGWFSSKKVLVKTASLINVYPKLRRLTSSLNRQDIEKAPSVQEHQPIGAKQSKVWIPGFDQSVYLAIAGGAGFPSILYQYEGRPDFDIAVAEQIQSSTEANHLRSADDMVGYEIHETDGEFGSVSDLIFNPANWSLVFFAIDTGSWLAERLIVIAPSWVKKISWVDESITVNMTKDQIESGPPLLELEGLEKSFESELYAHYGYPYM